MCVCVCVCVVPKQTPTNGQHIYFCIASPTFWVLMILSVVWHAHVLFDLLQEALAEPFFHLWGALLCLRGLELLLLFDLLLAPLLELLEGILQGFALFLCGLWLLLNAARLCKVWIPRLPQAIARDPTRLWCCNACRRLLTCILLFMLLFMLLLSITHHHHRHRVDVVRTRWPNKWLMCAVPNTNLCFLFWFFRPFSQQQRHFPVWVSTATHKNKFIVFLDEPKKESVGIVFGVFVSPFSFCFFFFSFCCSLPTPPCSQPTMTSETHRKQWPVRALSLSHSLSRSLSHSLALSLTLSRSLALSIYLCMAHDLSSCCEESFLMCGLCLVPSLLGIKRLLGDCEHHLPGGY